MPQKFVSHLSPPLKPANGNTLNVLVMTRISTDHQDTQSLDDQANKCTKYVRSHFDGQADFHTLRCQGSGECIVRPDLEEAQRLIKAGNLDLIIAEDLGRIMRRVEVFRFCEMCEDHDVRVIAINDHVDTATGNWRMLAMFSSVHHETHNKDASERIKRSADNRFITNGGSLPCLVYGYVKDKSAKTDDKVSKDPKVEPVYDRWFTMLEDGASYAEVADWLNKHHIPTGPISQNKVWDHKMVSRVTHNPILKGLRQRGRRITKRRNSTGKHYTIPAPPEHLKERDCPHLAFIKPDRYDRVLAKLDARNSQYRRAKNGRDPMAGRPKRRSTWPGQSVCCGICGRNYVWGGHGQTSHLMCSGAKDYRCWNALSIDGQLAATKIAGAVLDAIKALPDFESGFRAMVGKELADLNNTIGRRKKELMARHAEYEKKLQNLMDFIMNGGDHELAIGQQQTLKVEMAEINIELAKLDKIAEARPELPSIDTIKQSARGVFLDLVTDDQELARKLRRLIPVIQIFPVRCIIGGNSLPRARFVLKLAHLFDGIEQIEQVDDFLTRTIEVDLFSPTQPVAFREQVLTHKARRRPDGKPYTQRQIADTLGVTQPVVERAMKLHRAMTQLMTLDPYQELTQPPTGTRKIRRHLHPRYRFEPLPDHTPLTPVPTSHPGSDAA